MAVSVSVHKSNQLIAIGMKDGSVRLYYQESILTDSKGSKSNTHHLIYCELCYFNSQCINDLKFSPQGDRLVAGSSDNKLYCYEIDPENLREAP